MNGCKFSALIAVLAGCFFSTGCADRTDPVKEAIINKVKDTNPDVEVFTLNTTEQTQAVSLKDELERRRALFVTKEKACRKAVDKYVKANMQTNASIQTEKRQEAEDIIARIDAYRDKHAASLDSTLYYVVKFSGSGRTYDKAKIEVKDYFVTVTPDGKVLSLIPAGGNPYQRMGSTIPGYFTEILGRKEGENGAADED